MFTKSYQFIVKHNISTVLNADQTAVFYEYLPTKTINATGESTVWVKCGGKDKERATVMLLANWHGKKYLPIISFKAKAANATEKQRQNESTQNGFGPVLWPKMNQLQIEHGCQIYNNPTAWWNANISLKFLSYHFADRPNIEEKRLDEQLSGLDLQLALKLKQGLKRRNWNKLTTTTIIGGCSRVGVLDTRVADLDTEQNESIVEELAEELRCLRALGKPVHSEHDIRTDGDEN
ncbi:unnamed protein product [Phytophthora lilii]|uniref:Unnamed protein product n=1 Tax=Phytophthora lilii TaxID=2077276 RepID=A0A9W6TQI2_9STRA|nr:unnamed protein product [Phytophthora lilii]